MSTASDKVPEGPVAAGESDREFRTRALTLAVGWLSTNLGYSITTVPLDSLVKNDLGASPTMQAMFGAIGNVSNYFKPLAGVMTDSVPLCGTRRRHYLLFSLLLTAVGWIALALAPRQYYVLVAVYAVMYVGVVFVSTTLGGIMVEAGHHFRAAGRLTSQRIATFKIAELIATPIGGYLAMSSPFLVPAAMCAGLHLALVPFMLRYLPREPRVQADGAAWEQFKRQGKVVIRSRTLLGAAGVVFLLAASPGMNTPLFNYQQDTLKFDLGFIGICRAITAASGIVGAAIYFAACRRLNLKTLVAFSVIGHSLGALTFIGYRDHTSAVIISGIYGLTGTLAMLPVYDIAARATPKGSEAIGYALMMSMWNFTSMLSNVSGAKLFEIFGHDLVRLAWIDAGTTLIALVVIPFMPRALASTEQSAEYGNDPDVARLMDE